LKALIQQFLSKFKKPPTEVMPVKRPPVRMTRDMIRTYSKRLLSPYVGVVQVAEVGHARALSIDGDNWAIRYAMIENEEMRNAPLSDDPRVNYTLVATVEQGRMKSQALHPILDPEEVKTAIEFLFEVITTSDTPFTAGDHYECWLLDAQDNKPLALLHSTANSQEIAQQSISPVWIAMPHAQLEVIDPLPHDDDVYVPPINDRLQKLIKSRAGDKPRAAWFKRTDSTTEEFPPCLIREDWEDEADQLLCDLYIKRLAPRLLMIDGLPRAVRQRLEQAACEYVFDVERFYRLYPEVVDQSLLNTARVEARMRRAASS
jgi:hypothetical protein